MGIKLPRIFTSYNLWINQDLVASAGTIGTSRQEVTPQVAQAIERSFSRASDLVARYGGEEFVVLIPEAENSEAVNIAHSLKETIEKLQIPHHYSSTSSYITVSIGVATGFPCNESSPKELFTEADKALYRAKAEGKNQVNNWGHIKNY